MGKSLGYHIAAGMVQGLGAGIIENAKQKKEEALRRMELAARQQEGAADRAHREQLSAKELASTEARSNAEIGMRKQEYEAGREERKDAREESNRRWESDSHDRRVYQTGMLKNAETRIDNAPDPNATKPPSALDVAKFLKDKHTKKEFGTETTDMKAVQAEALTRWKDRPDVLQALDISPDMTGRTDAPMQDPTVGGTPGTPGAGPPAIVIPKDKRADVDRITADFRAKYAAAKDPAAKKALEEEYLRNIQALTK